MAHNLSVPDAQLSERNILGAVFSKNSLMRTALADFPVDDFALDSHRRLYRWALDCDEAGKPFDISTAIAEFAAAGKLSSVGGAGYVVDLTYGVVPVEGLVRQHVATVRKAACQRRALLVAERLQVALKTPGTDQAESIQTAIDDLMQLQNGYDLEGNLLPYDLFRSKRGLQLIQASTVTVEAQKWIVQEFLPDGTLTLIVGNPGAGKTTIVLSIAAAISRGRVPIVGGGRRPGRVIWISTEECASRVIETFLRVGGDIDNLLVEYEDPKGTPLAQQIYRSWQLGDWSSLGRLLAEHKPDLVVIDSLNSHTPSKVDLHRHSEVTELLIPLRRLAELHECAIVCIHHTNKSASTDPLQRVSGSQGIIATARHAILVGKSPQDASKNVAVVMKSNLARRQPAYGFDFDPFTWTGACEVTADDLSQPVDSVEQRSSLNDAVEFLQTELARGPQPTREIEAKAKAVGIKLRTLERARCKAGVEFKKESFSGRFMLSLKADHEVRHDIGTGGVGEVGGLGGVGTPITTTSNNILPMSANSAMSAKQTEGGDVGGLAGHDGKTGPPNGSAA